MLAISAQIIDVIKSGLRTEGITYAQLAKKLKLSEATVKRMFSKRNFPLKRLDEICTVCKLDLPALLQHYRPESHLIDHLSLRQERQLVEDKPLLLIALCAMNHMSLADIIATYDLTETDCLRCLVKLDRMGFLALHPHNRIQPLVSRMFRWHPAGPIQALFREHVTDYFDTTFQHQDEMFGLINVMLSNSSRDLLLMRIQALIDEIVQSHNRDSTISFEKRNATSILLAARKWELPFMRRLRR